MRTICARAPGIEVPLTLDCSRLQLTGTAFDFFHDHAKVAFSPGENFGARYGACARLNFATSPAILEQIVARMAAAVRSNTSRQA